MGGMSDYAETPGRHQRTQVMVCQLCERNGFEPHEILFVSGTILCEECGWEHEARKQLERAWRTWSPHQRLEHAVNWLQRLGLLRMFTDGVE